MLNIADLFVYLDLGPEEPDGAGPLPADRDLGDITLEAVSFRDPQRPDPALAEIAVTIRRRERVALVGGTVRAMVGRSGWTTPRPLPALPRREAPTRWPRPSPTGTRPC